MQLTQPFFNVLEKVKIKSDGIMKFFDFVGNLSFFRITAIIFIMQIL